MIKRSDLEEIVKQPLFRSEMQRVFFAAMNAGYANDSEKGSIIELPGSRTIHFNEDAPWKVIDTYIVTPLSSYSGGMTIISYEGGPFG